MEHNSLLIRYDEIALKGRNRNKFEKKLVENIQKAFSKENSKPFKILREHGRLMINGENLNPYILKTVFGVSSVSPAIEVANSADEIISRATEIAEREWKTIVGVSTLKKSFRVSTQRGFKKFPSTSMEIESAVGKNILNKFPNLKVDLTKYDLELGIDVRFKNSYIFTERILGPRGLPNGINRKLVALISGGIDSPVAAWMMMKRGCPIVFAHFHAPPYTGPAAKQKIIELVSTLRRYQGSTTLYIIPFAQVQLSIKKNAPERYRTILYRRMMHRIAEVIRIKERAYALVTGDSLGQVSSQTVENMRSIIDAVPGPIFQPLIGMDKIEIIERARKIGTFELSIQDTTDCCTLFTPKSPATNSTIRDIREIEESFEFSKIINDALEMKEKIVI